MLSLQREQSQKTLTLLLDGQRSQPDIIPGTAETTTQNSRNWNTYRYTEGYRSESYLLRRSKTKNRWLLRSQRFLVLDNERPSISKSYRKAGGNSIIGTLAAGSVFARAFVAQPAITANSRFYHDFSEKYFGPPHKNTNVKKWLNQSIKKKLGCKHSIV